ncbi:MAG: AarF/UbiB family protein [Phycisphaerae bacterium]
MKKTMLGRSVEYAGLALEMRKAKRSQDDAVQHNARRHVAERMGRLRGLPQKIGQMLAMNDDDEKASAYTDLGNAAEPIPFHEATEVMNQAWGASYVTKMSTIDTHGHAASLGQVHKAETLDGQTVAIKVAYPGIRQAVMNDLKMLGWLSAPVGDLRRGFDISDYRSEVIRDLDEELDYHRELQHQQQFRRLAESIDGLVVPQPIPDLCAKDVLVSCWEDGESVEGTRNWTRQHRSQLGRTLLKQFFHLLFDHGVVHGDPHPGNYRFRMGAGGQPEVVLYDYGSVLYLSERDRLLLLRLIRDTVEMQGSPLPWLVELGFSADLLKPIEHKLPALCRILFEPFLNKPKFDLTNWNRKAKFDDMLGDDRWNFRMAGPAKLILLMRAFRGVVFYLSKWEEPVSWRLLLEPVLERHRSALNALETTAAADLESEAAGFQCLAKHLRIEVLKENQRHVSLTFPAASVENLSDLMDPDLESRLRQDGQDLEAVVRAARQSCYAPGELFSLRDEEQERTVKLWLE